MIIAVTGSTGFLGRYLIPLLATDPSIRIRGLTRQVIHPAYANVEYVQGDMDDPAAMDSLLEPGCTLVHLAYSNTAASSAAIQTTERLIEACADTGVRRLIHCSSVAVYGRQSGIVTEATACTPYDAYGKAKLIIDETLLNRVNGRFDLVILRPTVVFGPGGEALTALATSLLHRSRAVNYLRSSLFGRRHMHLVPVDHVALAFRFCCQQQGNFAGSIYNVSMDEQELNNFSDIERVLMQALAIKPYIWPPLPIPSSMLEVALRLAKRSVVNPRVVYSGDKLQKLGFSENADIEARLREFALHFISSSSIDGLA